MATVDRFHRFIADHVHHHASDHAAWWEVVAYVFIALMLGVLLASAFTFAVPRMMAGF
ncbi:hypothetical protein [Reyranella sp. CPCC 100927]|uniref:hypothetical protein n=1 Tax=Reyranella sp. CPCC 100927 TaxID=2599616 RepID=UPI0015B771F7|nr:hypothetical protein [Reyranella sp. CPCC 100927]